MKRLLAVSIVCSVVSVHFALAQRLYAPAIVEQDLKGSYAIAGSHLLQKDDAMVRAYFNLHPEALRKSSLSKSTSWGFSVGSTHAWYTLDFTTRSFISVSSTCRAVGANCYVFVEDAEWTNGHVTQASVDSVEHTFDLRTPAYPSKGVFVVDTSAFGDPPDVDSDPKIIILILDIRDGWSGSGGYVAGYFHSVNELPTSQNANSNHAEIYYLDSHPLNLTSAGGLAVGMSTTAHEFQHMIHFNYNLAPYNKPSDETVINEGWSLVAEVNCGYTLYDQTGFTSQPNRSWFYWSSDQTDVLKDYSRAARYALYLRDQFTMAIFKNYLTSAHTDTVGINDALAVNGTSLRFRDVLKNWFIANTLNDRGVNTAYGYVYSNVPNVVPVIYSSPNVATTTRQVQPLAADYVSFRAGKNLSTTFTVPSGSTLMIKAIEKGSSNRVLDVTPGTVFNEPNFGTTYTEVTFAVMNFDASVAQSYSFTATGTNVAVEQRYDYREPTGVLLGADKDTVCVTFDAVAGARIDSIRVALRRNTAIHGGLWTYSGATRPSPLGTPLTSILTVSGIVTPSVPYPVPWPNWVTIDLRSSNISANNPFAVAFVVDGNYQTDATVNRVMTTTVPVPGKVTSLTYSSTSSSGPNWYYFVSNTAGDSMYIYLVRAYASFATGVQEPVVLAPRAFTLEQNYPNPFNPNTQLEFTLAERSHATLRIYNTLGQEVSTLFDNVAEAGRVYQATFDAAKFPSGIYYARLDAGENSATRKLVLLK